MSESIGGIHYDLDLKGKGEFDTLVKSADAKMGGLAKRFKAAEVGSTALLAAVVGLGAGLVKFGIDSVNAYNEAHRAEVELVQLHQKNTGATEKQTQSLIRQANALQEVGVVEGDAIIKGQAQLATFKLSTSAIKNLTPAMTDMVAKQKGVNATGEDFINIGNLIGKVMDGNIGALGRYGVSYSVAEAKIMKTGNAEQRSATLAKVLANNYGGVNKALRDTPEGKMASIKNKWGDIQEALGDVINKGMEPFITALDDQISLMGEDGTILDYFRNLLEENKNVVYAVAGAIMIGLVPALYAAAAGVWAILAPLLPFLAIGALLGVLINKLVVQFGGWNNLIGWIKLSMMNLWNAIAPTLIPALQFLWNMISVQLIPALQKLWNIVSPILIPALQFIAKVLGVVLYAAFIAIIYVIGLVIGGISNIVGGFAKWWNILKDNIPVAVNRFYQLWNGVKDVFGKIGSKISDLGGWFRGIPGTISSALGGIWSAIMKPFDDVFRNLKWKLDDIKRKIADALNPFVRHSPSLVDWVHKGTEEITNTYEGMFDRLASVSAQNRSGMVGAVKSVSGAVEGGNQGGFSKGNVVNNYSIEPKGIIARTPGELREIAGQLLDLIGQGNVMSGPQVKIIK